MSAGGKRVGAGRKPGSQNRATAKVQELARDYAPAALHELARLAKSAKSESARIHAIKEILDRAYGRPHQTVANEFEGQQVNFIIAGLGDPA